MNVLGTGIDDLGSSGEDAQDGPAMLCSDLHVPSSGGRVVEQLRAFCRAAVDLQARLFILGDLFDSYVSPKQLKVAAYREVALLLRETVHAGCRLFVLHGNRDFLLGREFEVVTGGRVVPGGIRCTLAGRRALLLHGDELCQDDLPYQRAKKWLRSPITRAIARRLPLRTAMNLAERARNKSRAVTGSGDQSRFLPTMDAVSQAFAAGCDLLVFGHIHRPARGPFGAGEYVVLPAFDEGGVGLLCRDGTVQQVQATADGVAKVDAPGAAAWYTPAAAVGQEVRPEL